MEENDHSTVEDRTGPDPTDQSPRDDPLDRGSQRTMMQWTKFVTALFALIGVGFGLIEILLDAVDQDIVEAGTGPGAADAAFEASVALPIAGPPYLAAVAAVVVGIGLGWYFERDDPMAYRVAGVSTFAGSIAFWFLAALFGSVRFDSASIDFGGLLLSAIVAGVCIGLVAAGGVWAVRTLAPDGVAAYTPRRNRDLRFPD